MIFIPKENTETEFLIEEETVEEEEEENQLLPHAAMAEDSKDDQNSLLLLAQKKYQAFEEQCADILDPARVSELELMKSLGLPTMLVNNYADMNGEDEEQEMVCVIKDIGSLVVALG